MAEFSTPVSKKFNSKLEANSDCQTSIKIPPSPFLNQIGYGCGVGVFTLERSPKVGFARSPWALKKRNGNMKKDSKFNDRLILEAKILRNLSHPNIVGFRAFTHTTVGEPCLAMEKLDMSLGDIIEERLESGINTPFPATNILYISYEIAKGLEYLHHTVHLLHGDIKSFNVLITKDFSTVKICDFGVSLPLDDSLHLDSQNGNYTYVGTECWTAPEIIFETGPITNKADIWAYGLVIWEMLALSPPHVTDDGNSETTYDSVTELKCPNEKKNVNMTHVFDEGFSFLETTNSTVGTRPPLPAIEFSCEYNHVLEIFFSCTDVDYRSRPSAKGIVLFFKNYVTSKDKK